MLHTPAAAAAFGPLAPHTAAPVVDLSAATPGTFLLRFTPLHAEHTPIAGSNVCVGGREGNLLQLLGVSLGVSQMVVSFNLGRGEKKNTKHRV